MNAQKYSSVHQIIYNVPKIVYFDILRSMRFLPVLVNLFIAVSPKNNHKTQERTFYEIQPELCELLMVTAFVQKSDDVSNCCNCFSKKTIVLSSFNTNSDIYLLLLCKNYLYVKRSETRTQANKLAGNRSFSKMLLVTFCTRSSFNDINTYSMLTVNGTRIHDITTVCL